MSKSTSRGASQVLPPPAAPVKGKSASEPSQNAIDPDHPDPKVIDMDILGQLLEMDDDEEHSFSRPLVEEYLEQAGVTLKEMEEQLKENDKSKAEKLAVLSDRGHFLKGSSAALGVIQVRDSCEALQNLGKCKDAAGQKEIEQDVAWKECEKLIIGLKDQQEHAQKWLSALCKL